MPVCVSVRMSVYVMVITLLLPAGPALRVPSFEPTLRCSLSSKPMAPAEQDGVPAAVTSSLSPRHFPAPLHLLPESELHTPLVRSLWRGMKWGAPAGLLLGVAGREATPLPRQPCRQTPQAW